MARSKIDYGIDLGTTNSAICRMEKGVPVIKKTDKQTDTMPSCVSFKKKRIQVGCKAFNGLRADKLRASHTWENESSNSFVEFKRTMGTNTTYYSSDMDKNYLSEDLSAEVLKSLKSFITDENFSSVVITVPAKFTVNQKTATIKAAELAGFEQCELLQEPIAAAYAYGINNKLKNGYLLVFDFGGGTFDSALINVEDGIMTVIDTEGDNYLGGKDLDYAIVDKLLLPKLSDEYEISDILADETKKQILRDALKWYAEETKNTLSFDESAAITTDLGDLGEDDNDEELELDLNVTREQVNEILTPIFQKAVDICKKVLNRNSVTSDKLTSVLLVGGPTYCPLIRNMLVEQVCPVIDTSIDPMTAVAVGAALFASTVDACDSVKFCNIDDKCIPLDIGFEATTVEESEWVTIKLREDQTIAKLQVELVSSDQSWSSGRVDVDHSGNIIQVMLKPGKANNFTVNAYLEDGTRQEVFPKDISIIQGSKIAAAPLPYSIGIAKYSIEKDKEICLPLKGLEKNKAIPAIGVKNDELKTPTKLRPGQKNDILTIPVYQVDGQITANLSARLYEHVADVVITGNEIDQEIPENSEVHLTLRVKSSEMMTLEVYFPSLDISIEKDLDTTKHHAVEEASDEILQNIEDAERQLKVMQNHEIATTHLEERLFMLKEENDNSSEKKAVLQHSKEVLRDIESLSVEKEWDMVAYRIEDLLEKFDSFIDSELNEGNGSERTILENFKTRYKNISSKKSIAEGKILFEQLSQAFTNATLIYQVIGRIRDMYEDFDSYPWTDRQKAKILVEKAYNVLQRNPTKQAIMSAFSEITHVWSTGNKNTNSRGLLV